MPVAGGSGGGRRRADASGPLVTAAATSRGCGWSGPGAWPRRSTFAARAWTRHSRRSVRYLDDAALAGLDQVLIIHGLGTGALRDAVRAEAASHPLVKSVRAGERGEGGDGATIIRL